ncbi:uncharacterized protein LOC117579103 [Drosophila guanche]|uniref:Uncharacterized protein n=1 Tax=Drosophila guanche TaxID=7266 RepID=A0A3B0JUX8_DROGU|nr:uncharacterized protein LOC117579103 [Drosophila guanche]SPP76541.1 Hypothetical predicted protein [Drosophila guanche]
MWLWKSQWECLCLRMGLCLWLLVWLSPIRTARAWKCLYKEFPVDREKIKGGWWIYGSNPEAVTRCYLSDLDLYWTRITMTDYANYAVELHCSLPWFRHLLAIYTRSKEPTQETIDAVSGYLKSVNLSLHNFTLVMKPENCENQQHEPWQRWHLSRYLHLEYHPHYLKPLIDDDNI